jgi:hypothetical protein
VAHDALRVLRKLGARIEAACPDFSEVDDIVLGTRALTMVALHADKLPQWRERMQKDWCATSNRGAANGGGAAFPRGAALPDADQRPAARQLHAVVLPDLRDHRHRPARDRCPAASRGAGCPSAFRSSVGVARTPRSCGPRRLSRRSPLGPTASHRRLPHSQKKLRRLRKKLAGVAALQLFVRARNLSTRVAPTTLDQDQQIGVRDRFLRVESALLRRDARVAEGGALLRRYTGLNPYRGFESLSLRQTFHRKDGTGIKT